MKLKKVRALMAALSLVVGTALCVSTVAWARSLNPDPISIINEDGAIIKSAIESDRTIYLGSTQTQDIQSKILEKLCSADTIKKDSLTAKDVSITLKSELVFDEEKNEFVESENDIKDVMTVKDDEITFAKEGFFLAEVSIKEDKCNVIFDIDDKVLAYADLNDWVVLNNTKSPDFSVKFDSKEIKSVKYDDSKVKVGTDGKYVLTYTITDAENHVVKKEVLVTVGDKKVVNELSEKGVWVANGKTVAGNSSTTKPVVKPENKPSKPSKPENSGNHGEQNPSVPNRPEKPETPENPDKPEKPEKPQHVHTFGDWQVKKPATCEKTGLKERFCTDTDCNKKEIRKIPALGHDLKETVITEPTCGTAGSKEVTCTRCDFKDTQEIPATGNHAYGDWVIVKEATCTEEGLRTQTCANCGDVKKEVLPKVDHTWNEGEVSKQPTCTENGERTFTCTICQETKTEVITATGHAWSDWEVKTPATCETEGQEERHCTNEGCTEVEFKVIPALGHDLKEEIVKEPTCGETGLKNVTCSRCDYKEENVEIPATGEHKFGEWIVTKEPSCGNAGEETRTCDVCYHTETRPIAPVAEHKWNEGEITKQPTCTEDGSRLFTCTVCGDTKTEVIPALGHAWSDWDIKDSTCGQEGEKTRHCTRTGCTATETVKIPASENHKWNDGVVTKNATCTEQGEITYTCNDCGHTKVEKTPALGHDLKEVILKQPTCSESGLKAMVCQRPGCDHKENEVSIPATGEHHWDEGVVTKQPTCITKGEKTYTCEHCGEKRYEEIGLIDHLWEKIFEKQPDKVVTEEHYICNQCGMDFGDDADAAGKHTIVTQGCQNYSLKQVQVTIPGETIEVGRKCSVCNKEERH
ncbi:hypothetical protein [Blautia sp.]|uniref:hypothetical protein n=1 Tax=Blautia sp. TaxID=1955243 RepID=UPI00257BDFD2|nr:hypothetical protein [Blautia sp.]MBS7171784.1 hypothetical protein [Blautia sp.]